MWLMMSAVTVAVAQQTAANPPADQFVFDAKTIVSIVAVCLTVLMAIYTISRNRRTDLSNDIEKVKAQLQQQVGDAKASLEEHAKSTKKGLEEHAKQAHGRVSKQVGDCDKRFEKLEGKDMSFESRIQDLEKNMSRCEGADFPRRVSEVEKSASLHGLAIERIGTEVKGAKVTLAGAVAKIDRMVSREGA